MPRLRLLTSPSTRTPAPPGLAPVRSTLVRLREIYWQANGWPVVTAKSIPSRNGSFSTRTSSSYSSAPASMGSRRQSRRRARQRSCCPLGAWRRAQFAGSIRRYCQCLGVQRCGLGRHLVRIRLSRRPGYRSHPRKGLHEVMHTACTFRACEEVYVAYVAYVASTVAPLVRRLKMRSRRTRTAVLARCSVPGCRVPGPDARHRDAGEGGFKVLGIGPGSGISRRAMAAAPAHLRPPPGSAAPWLRAMPRQPRPRPATGPR